MIIQGKSWLLTNPAINRGLVRGMGLVGVEI